MIGLRKRFYFKFIHISLWHLYAIMIGALGALVLCWWFVVYAPLIKKQVKAQATITHAHEQNLVLKKTKHEIQNLTKTIDSLKHSLQSYSGKQTKNQTLQSCLAYLSDAALASGLSIAVCKIGNQYTKSWGSTTDLIGEYKGTFDQIIAFFDQLKNNTRAISCNRCELTRSSNDLFCLQVNFSVASV